MKDQDGPTGESAARDGENAGTDPALSSHTFTGSADRVALRVTPAHGDVLPGTVEVVDAASMPVGSTVRPPEIIVRQLYPDTVIPPTGTRTTPSRTPLLPPQRRPMANVRGRGRGTDGVLSKPIWFVVAAIVIALVAIGIFIAQGFGRTADAVLPSASAPAVNGMPATPAASLAPALAPPPSSIVTAVPVTAALPTSISSTATALSPTIPGPTPVLAPLAIPTAEPTTVPTPAPTAVSPTSVSNSPPSPPAVIPAVLPQQGANPAATVSLPAIPRVPTAIPLPATNIPPVPQLPRKP